MADRQMSRRKAYDYIVSQIKTNVNWIPPIDSDKRLADLFDISIDDLDSLKNGSADPPHKLVVEFKKLLGPITGEEEIDRYLVDPFITDS